VLPADLFHDAAQVRRLVARGDDGKHFQRSNDPFLMFWKNSSGTL
jgi:hypothetical protein